MADIFVSYRQDDTVHFAARLTERLRDTFGPSSIFLAPDDIPPGQPFEVVLREQLQRCRILLAIIGKRWLVKMDHAGGPGPIDYVDLEVTTALQRPIPTVPIRVDGAPVPTNLSGPLAKLPDLQWERIDTEHFHSGVDRLVERLEKYHFLRRPLKMKLGVVLPWLPVACVLILLLSASVTGSPTCLRPLPLLVGLGLIIVLFSSPERRRPWQR